MEIREVSFRASALKASDRPQEWFPHIAVAGRSNVGKSSLLNWLMRQNKARVAKAPGKTRMLNYFLINGSYFLVDLPGYGYAKVNRALQEEWGRELGNYLATEERLAGVMTLVDVRHGPTELDLGLQDMLIEHGRPRLVVLTKADKVKRGQRARMQFQVQKKLGLPRPPLVVSVKTGEGRKELLTRVDELIDGWRSKRST
ncbi:MAG: ribosome biogenesis GTP-binding protein YihA/YsxC [Thermoanaerobaculales bacterium]|nr:ribosome biogenesis GTP-binding protein YihA/YsxC [Thermoanaerobaculales bacterium]